MASAKKAKKSRKTTPKRSKAALPSRKQRSLENVATPEELMAKLDGASQEHDKEVAVLAQTFIRAIKKSNYHPTVVLDTLQVLLSEGIGDSLGEEQQELFSAHMRSYHQDSRMLSVANMLGIKLSDLTIDPGTGEQPESAPYTPPEPSESIEG